jgi:hypothetical protein
MLLWDVSTAKDTAINGINGMVEAGSMAVMVATVRHLVIGVFSLKLCGSLYLQVIHILKQEVATSGKDIALLEEV